MNGSTRHTIHLQTTNDGGSCATTADRQKWPHVPWSPQSVNSMDWCKAKAYRETLDFIGKSMVSEFPVKNFDPETSPGWSNPAGSSQRTKFGAGLFDPRVGYCNWSWLLSDTTPRILVPHHVPSAAVPRLLFFLLLFGAHPSSKGILVVKVFEAVHRHT